ncbi:hypothetical protein [Microcoleus sp. FACHB-68]|nr:hypothetical protein [Microcoleus sp. FACHB-68]MBD1937574.1 hypothetical protein [Microcoleus sp. FACHB-68]
MAQPARNQGCDEGEWNSEIAGTRNSQANTICREYWLSFKFRLASTS